MQITKNFLRRLQLRGFGKSEDGSAMVLVALALASLMLMAGMGIDVGYLRYQKEQMQKAADAGAMAAASALVYNGNYVTSATNDTTANGFAPTTTVVGGLCSPTGSDICVAVNNPPQTPGDPFFNQAGYVEVIVSQPRPTFFMRVGGWNSVAVSSRAVATTTSSASGCMYVMDQNPSDSGTLQIDGKVGVSAPNCAIYVDTPNSNSIVKNGTSGSIEGSYIGTVGGDNINGNFTFTCEWNAPGAPCPATQIVPFQDPFVNVPSPTAQACGTGVRVGNTFSPGAYCGGISLTGNGNYTFLPGQYTIMNGFSVGGNVQVSGSGVLFYLTGNSTNPYGGISFGSNTVVSFTAETTGPQAGILFFQDRSICNPASLSCAQSHTNESTFNGNGGNSFSGAFYFPTTSLVYSGTPSLSDSAILVGYTMEFNGNAQLNNNYLSGQSPLRTALLVE